MLELEAADLFSMSLWNALALFFANPLIRLCLVFDLAWLLLILVRRPDLRPRIDALSIRPWSAREADIILLALIALLLAGRALVIAFFRDGWSGPSALPHPVLLMQLLFFHLPAIALILFLLRRQALLSGSPGMTWREGLRHGRRGVSLCLAILPLVGGAGIVASHVLMRTGIPAEPQEIVRLIAGSRDPWMLAFMALLALAIAPLVEEFVFRGLALSSLMDRMGVAASVVVASALFASFHFNLHAWVPLFVLAVGFSLAYLYSGTLLVPIVMHTAFNSLNLLVLFVTSLQTPS